MTRSPTPFPPLPAGDPRTQATYWLTVLDSGLAGAAERRAFAQWLAADPTHGQAWEDAQAFQAQLDALIAAHGDVAPAPCRARPRGTGPRWAVAAMLLLAVTWWGYASPWLYADYATGIGESRSLGLADGSHLQLNTDTALDFDSGAVRRLTLHRGEVFVQVAADAAHPFEVATPAGTVRALGTAFAVRLEGDAARVTVYEHAVRVMPKHGQPVERLVQGRGVLLHPARAGTPETVDLGLAGAWRRHRLVFQDRPLGQVLEEMNRYRRIPILLASTAVAAIPVTGAFDNRDTDAALAMLESSLGLGSVRIPGGLVVLYGG